MRLWICLLWAVLFLQACHADREKPTYQEAFLANDGKAAGFFQTHLPKDQLIGLNSGWVFLGLDSLIGIHREWPELFSKPEPVALPHRLPLPNHSLWYQWEGMLKPGILLVDADDGVQCWLNGKRVPRAEKGDFFVVGATGESSLGLRVVNNAMAGGLRRVQFLPLAAHESLKTKKNQIRDGVLSDRKLELLQDNELKEEWESLSYPELSGQLAEYPILFTLPVLIWSTDGRPFVRWVSESAGTAILGMENGEEIRIQSTDGIFTHELESGSRVNFGLYQDKSFHGNFTFETKTHKDNIKVALLGDSQGGWETFRKVADAISAHQADLSVGAGDLVNNGSEDWAYPRLLQLLSRMQTPQLLVPGNHDYDGHYDDLYARQMHFKAYDLEGNIMDEMTIRK